MNELWKLPKAERKTRAERIEWLTKSIQNRREEIQKAKNNIEFCTHAISVYRKELDKIDKI